MRFTPRTWLAAPRPALVTPPVTAAAAPPAPARGPPLRDARGPADPPSTHPPESRPLLRKPLALTPDLKIRATPWSPPAWMKTNDSLVGGRLIDDVRVYHALAQYFVKLIKAYQRAGVPIDAVTIQNEPQ